MKPLMDKKGESTILYFQPRWWEVLKIILGYPVKLVITGTQMNFSTGVHQE